MTRFDLSDEEWRIIEPLLPKRGRRPARRDDRVILNGIFYILRTGAPWRDLPERYGHRPLFTFGMYAGESGVSGGRSLMRWRKSVKMPYCLSMVLSSRLTVQRLGQKRGTSRGYWPLTRRSHK